MKETISCLVLVEKKLEIATKEEIKEVLKENDGDLKRLSDFKGKKIVWGYLCKVKDWFTCYTMEMDKVLLLIEDNEVCSYEPTGNFYPEHKEYMRVVGLMDENAEIEPIERVEE